MDYFEAVETLRERLPGYWAPRDLSHAAEGMAAQAEFSKLSPTAVDWSAKRLGFKSGSAMTTETASLLDHARQMGNQGLTGAAREFERQVTRLQQRAVQVFYSGAR